MRRRAARGAPHHCIGESPTGGAGSEAKSVRGRRQSCESGRGVGTCVNAYVNAYVNVCINACVNVCINARVNARVNACINARVNARVNACINACINARVNVCINACVTEDARVTHVAGHLARTAGVWVEAGLAAQKTATAIVFLEARLPRVSLAADDEDERDQKRTEMTHRVSLGPGPGRPEHAGGGGA